MRIAALALTALVAACAHPRALGRPLDRATLSDPGWVAVDGVPDVRQERADDCGVAAAAMVLAYWRRDAPEEAPVRDGGLRAAEVRGLLRARGLRAYVIEGTVDDLRHELGAGRPVIVGTVTPVSRRRAQSHYVVVIAISDDAVAALDPATGLTELPLDRFTAAWAAAAHTTVVVMEGEDAAASR